MLRNRFLSGLTAILLTCSFRAHADGESVLSNDAPAEATNALVIDGDKLELHLDRKMRAIGNASMSRGKQTILGDVIDYDVQNDTLQVTGNARINVGNAQLSGLELHMQLSENIGEITDASISMIKTAETRKTQDSLGVNSDMDSQPRSSQARGDAKAILFEGQDIFREHFL